MKPRDLSRGAVTLFLLNEISSRKTAFITKQHYPLKTIRGSTMEFIDVIMSRTSVRTYRDTPVEDEKINYVLDCARRAPSWENSQCWRFIVVKNKDTISKLAKNSLINHWLKTAPILIIACADATESGRHNTIEYYSVDVAIALEHLVLAATDVGLGTCWIGGFDEEKVKEQLEIPKRIRVVALTPLGYPADKKTFVTSTIRLITRGDKRKSLDEIVHYEHW
jgi:nitroreductase